ncbi:MAG: TaqI-like C-terminal specificity domain-containing protein [Methylococcales bacterium]|nr:TaqI-like C-terminal specificity domain-containing protein [Methylococcales bacterium]
MKNKTALFHPRIINKYLDAARILKNGEIPSKPKQLIEKWLSNQDEHKKRNEQSIREEFSVFFKDLLGYKALNDTKNAKTWSFEAELNYIDFALGKFTPDDKKISVPFEFKSTKTYTLDLPMLGRKQSAVQQASDYAKETNGTAQWFLVCNCLEFRLYKYPYSERSYEQWFIDDLIKPSEYARFVLLLSKSNLLGTKTEAIFKDSQALEKDITVQLYRDYRALRINLINGLKAENNHIHRREMVARAQKLMDRVMFIAFAENRGLLPRKSLYTRIEDEQSNLAAIGLTRWDLVKKLFTDINEGNETSAIFPYNGGLFAPDDKIEHLKVSDELLLGFKHLYSYDFAEIGTHILGHIFEQSITDLDEIYETLEEDELLINSQQVTGTSGKRKQDGVVYTPAFITEYIVKKTLGGYLTVKQAKIPHEQESVEYWLEYRELLAKTRVLDPACGSGAFLIGAFHYLKHEYENVNQQLSQFDDDPNDLFSRDLDKAILNHNLFGVDLNFESVEIAQLALWLETAEKGKKLNALGDNIQQGNSIIAHKNADKNAFNWPLRFNKVMNEGGFDVVLGNPPYVRQERLTAIKPYLEKYYADTFHGVADLYTYFFEQGLKLLKKEGRLGFISSSTFFRTHSGQKLRQFLNSHSNVKTIIDFGDYQVFAGVTTYPAILILEKPNAIRKVAPKTSFNFLTIKSLKQPEHKAVIIEMEAGFSQMKQASLKDDAWQLENEALAALRKKITDNKKTLKEVYGSPYYGIKTGFNEAFVINQAQYEDLKADDPKGDILRPFLEGKDLKRWRSESRHLYLIFTRRGVEIDNYPLIKAHLEQFRKRLEPKPHDWNNKNKWIGRKGGIYKWYEIQDTVAYYEKFEKEKIVWGNLQSKSSFFYDEKLYYINAPSPILATSEKWLVAYLNSNISWFFLHNVAIGRSGGFLECKPIYINQIPIPKATDEQKQIIAELAEQCQQQAGERYQLEQNVRDLLIENFRPENNHHSLNKKLLKWWTVSDIKTLNQEARKAFKLKKADTLSLDLSDPNAQMQWKKFLEEQSQAWQSFTDEIERLEKEINKQVYALFKLTSDEITCLEKSINL